MTKLQVLRTNNFNNIKKLNNGKFLVDEKHANAQSRSIKRIQEYSSYFQKQI